MLKTLLPIVLLFVAGSLFGAQNDTREFKVVGTNFHFIYEQAEDGSFSGLAVDVLNALAKRYHIRIHYHMAPWLRAQKQVELGQAQLLVGPYYSKERAAKFHYSHRAFYQDDLVFFASRDKQIHWDGNYANLGEYKLIKISGWYYGEAFEEALPHASHMTFTHLRGAIERLIAGDVDILAANQRNVRGLIFKHEMPGLVALEPIIGRQYGYMGFSKEQNGRDLKKIYDRFFSDLYLSGEFQRMSQQYGLSYQDNGIRH